MTTTDLPRIDTRAPHPSQAQGLRDGLIALAEYLTDLPEYPDPTPLFHAFVPWVDPATVDRYGAELLRCVVERHATTTANPFDLELALDYLTGGRW
jgi:hypothetical protein